jgi:hypothetical protein
MLNQHRRWLEAAGATVQAGVNVEISPLVAVDARDLAERLRGNPIQFAQSKYWREL